MANYTQQEVDAIMNNGFTVSPGSGWIEIEKYSSGYNEDDENGDPQLCFAGWQFSVIDADGNPVEFLLENTPENADESTRRNDAKQRMLTIEKQSS